MKNQLLSPRIFLVACLVVSCNIGNTGNKNELSEPFSNNAAVAFVENQANGNIISMDIDGRPWQTTGGIDVEVMSLPEAGIFEVYIGGENEAKQTGFTIKLNLMASNLQSPKGVYPIYAGEQNEQNSAQVIMNGSEATYNTAYLPGDRQGQKIGFVDIQEAKLQKDKSGDQYLRLSGTFELEMQSEDGMVESKKIKNGKFQANMSLTYYADGKENEESKIIVNLNGRNWDSDLQNIAVNPLDNGAYSIAISGSRSAMDMDVENRGWEIRLFLNIPPDKINNFKGTYHLGSMDNSDGEVYFEHDGQPELGNTSKVTVKDMEVLERHGMYYVTFLKAVFEIQRKGNIVTGAINIHQSF